MNTTKKTSSFLMAAFFLITGYGLHSSMPATLLGLFEAKSAYAAPIVKMTRGNKEHEMFLASLEQRYAGKIDPVVIRAASQKMLELAGERDRVLALRQAAAQPSGIKKLINHVSHLMTAETGAAKTAIGNPDAPLWLANSLTPSRS